VRIKVPLRRGDIRPAQPASQAITSLLTTAKAYPKAGDLEFEMFTFLQPFYIYTCGSSPFRSS
jgi:hypothetical protein